MEPKINTATVISFLYAELKTKGTGTEKKSRSQKGKTHISMHISDGRTGISYSQHMPVIAILWCSKPHQDLCRCICTLIALCCCPLKAEFSPKPNTAKKRLAKLCWLHISEDSHADIHIPLMPLLDECHVKRWSANLEQPEDGTKCQGFDICIDTWLHTPAQDLSIRRH